MSNDINPRNSSLDELFGRNRLTEPTLPGKVDWVPIIIHATVTAAIVAIPIITVVVIHNHRQNQKMEAMRNEYEEKLNKLKSEQELLNNEIVAKVFKKKKPIT